MRQGAGITCALGVKRAVDERASLVCLIAAERADSLLTPVREHFADQTRVAVRVERRAPTGQPPRSTENSRLHARAPVAVRDISHALPPALRSQVRHLRLVQRMVPLGRTHENTAMTELINRSRAMEPKAVSELWWRSYQRVHARLRTHLGEAAAMAATPDMLGRMLDALDSHDTETQPTTAWLDQLVDRYAREHRSPARFEPGATGLADALGPYPRAADHPITREPGTGTSATRRF